MTCETLNWVVSLLTMRVVVVILTTWVVGMFEILVGLKFYSCIIG